MTDKKTSSEWGIDMHRRRRFYNYEQQIVQRSTANTLQVLGGNTKSR